MKNLVELINKNFLKLEKEIIIIIEGGYFILENQHSNSHRINSLKTSINLANQIKELDNSNINIIHSLFINNMDSICTKKYQECKINNESIKINNNDLLEHIPIEAKNIYAEINNLLILKQKTTKNKSAKVMKSLINDQELLKFKNISLVKSKENSNILLKYKNHNINLGYVKKTGGVIVGCPSIMGQHYDELLSKVTKDITSKNIKVLIIDFNLKEEIDIVKDGVFVFKHCFNSLNKDVSIINCYIENDNLKFSLS